MNESYGCLNFPKYVHFNEPYYHIFACISKSFLSTLREVCDTDHKYGTKFQNVEYVTM